MPSANYLTLMRSITFVMAVIGSVLIMLTLKDISYITLLGFILMFLGALLAIISIYMALKRQNITEIIYLIILLMWLVLLPLALLIFAQQ